MLRSMTGIGLATHEDARRRVAVEARSVNHRQLKLSYRAPASLAALEGEVEARLRAHVARGAVHVAVDVRDDASGRSPKLDVAALRARTAELATLSLELTGHALSPLECFTQALRLPGAVATSEDAASADDELQSLVLKTAERAFAELAKSRASEGAKIEVWLRGHVAEIARVRDEIAARAPEIVRGLRDRLVERLNALMAEVRPGVVATEDAVLREAAHVAERVDVAEELNRLAGHVAHFEEIARDGKDAGRKLDFLAQEFLREANTVGSKASDLVVARSVVALKVEIEKFKEQVQNLE